MNDAVFVCVLVVCGLYCDLKKVMALALKQFEEKGVNLCSITSSEELAAPND